MNTPRILPFLPLLPFLAAALSAAGCQATTTISGKVIPGNVSFVGAVDPTDERLKSDGVAGVKVTATKNPQEVAARIGEATSDAKGNFRLVIRDQSALIRPVEFAASAPGVLPASSVMGVPASDRRLIIIVKPSGATGVR